MLTDNEEALARLDKIREGFGDVMSREFEAMWAKKLGLIQYDATMVKELLHLMMQSRADYTMFFRRLSQVPEELAVLKESFYMPTSEEVDARWNGWLQRWRERIDSEGDISGTSAAMKRVNPKYAWREWLIVPAYKKAEEGDYSLIRELQAVLSNPYEEQSPEIAAKYDRLKPEEFFSVGGVCHYSCSS